MSKNTEQQKMEILLTTGFERTQLKYLLEYDLNRINRNVKYFNKKQSEHYIKPSCRFNYLKLCLRHDWGYDVRVNTDKFIINDNFTDAMIGYTLEIWNGFSPDQRKAYREKAEEFPMGSIKLVCSDE